MVTVKSSFISFILATFFLLLLSNIVQAASYISISKTIRSDFDNIIDLTTSDPNDGSRDVVFRITINNTGDSSVHVHATDDLGNGQFYSADPSAPYDIGNILVPAYGKYEYDFRARYQGSNTTHGAAITSTARIIWIDGCYNYYQGIDCGVHGNLSSSQTVYIHNPAPPNQPSVARMSMTSQNQTVYENGTLNLTVTPGGTAHVDFSASRSSDPDGSVSSYQWRINGEPVSTSRDFDYVLNAGTHQILLDVWDNQGAQGAVGASIIIGENQLPVAGLSMTSQGQTVYENGTLNLIVTPGGTAHVDFSASRSSDPDGSVSSYQWRINGEPVSTSRDFDYVLNAGSHQILLDVWDNQGAQGAVGASIIISEDNIVCLDNGIVRVEVDLSQGGAIVEISHEGYNLVDTNDPGRLIQVSFWDDVNPNWNPIQAGDITGHLNPVTEYSSDSNSIYTKVRGINWLNTGTDPQWLDVDIEQWVTLEDQKVKVKYRVTHFGSDEHILHHQEFPSVYLRTELSESITYSGDNPWESDKVEHLGIIPGQSKFVMPTEHWAGFVNAEDFGLTIYSPYHTLLWKAERILGVSDPNYIAVVDQFALTPGSVHETEIYFIVGNYPDSRQLIYELESQNNAPKIHSIDPVTIEPSDFTLRINGNNFDQAIDQIYWKDDGHFVGQASEIISQSQTELVVPEKMAGAEPGAYLVTVRNSDCKLSNFVEMCVGNPIPNFVPLFRGYSCDDSDHFYTTDIVERNELSTYGYIYEKIEAYI